MYFVQYVDHFFDVCLLLAWCFVFVSVWCNGQIAYASSINSTIRT